MLQRRMLWIWVLYFIQGLPFGWFYDALPVYFRMSGVSLVSIGLLGLLEAPWSFKFIWSPLVDRAGRPALWIAGALLVMAVATTGLGTESVIALVVTLAVFTVASATQDIAIDAAFVRMLDRKEQAVGNGIRLTAYRVAMIAGGGVTVMLAGTVDWQLIFWGLAAALLLLSLVALRTPAPAAAAVSLAEWGRAFKQWLWRPAALPLALFIATYKLGDVAMGRMVRPFWVDRGMPPEVIGFVTTTLGIVASIAGALAGGWFTARRGIVTGLWVLGLAQAGSNLIYAAVAYFEPGDWAMWLASLGESLSGGLGTAAFLSLLTASCDREHAATQYALLSALFAVSRMGMSGVSGFGVEQLGYAGWFGITFLLSFPAYLLLPWVRRWLDGAKVAPAAAAIG